MNQPTSDPTIIRLACMNCDRDDFDMTTMQDARQAGWKEIGDANETYASNWWTHLGYCCECKDIVGHERETANN